MISVRERAFEYILIVDDEEFVQESLREFLETCGYLCEVASDASEALEVLPGNPFGMVISDIRMPGMDGIHFMKEAKRSFPHLDFIIMTGYTCEYTYIDIIRAGAADYLTKPFKMEEIRVRIRRIQREKHLLKEIKWSQEMDVRG